jgi:hypothetical protein
MSHVKHNMTPVMPKWTPFVFCEIDRARDDILVYQNSRYWVNVRFLHAKDSSIPAIMHITVCRRDRCQLVPFRDVMRMKRELFHPEIELVELFPAESRLADAANDYHYWGVWSTDYKFTIGYQNRIVSENNATLQTPFTPDDKPADCIPSDELLGYRQLYVADLSKLAMQAVGLHGTCPLFFKVNGHLHPAPLASQPLKKQKTAKI